MNMPCAVSGRRYATLPLPMAPMLVLNMRFIGAHGSQSESPQPGHWIDSDSSKPVI